MDEYGYPDPIHGWTTCKVTTGTVLAVLVFILVVARLSAGMEEAGHLGFAAIILSYYYALNLLLSLTKPQGVHHLCRGNLRALKKWKWEMDRKNRGVTDDCRDLIQRAKDKNMMDNLEIDEIELRFHLKGLLTAETPRYAHDAMS